MLLCPPCEFHFNSNEVRLRDTPLEWVMDQKQDFNSNEVRLRDTPLEWVMDQKQDFNSNEVRLRGLSS